MSSFEVPATFAVLSLRALRPVFASLVLLVMSVPFWSAAPLGTLPAQARVAGRDDQCSEPARYPQESGKKALLFLHVHAMFLTA